jgi:hypothetical protein
MPYAAAEAVKAGAIIVLFVGDVHLVHSTTKATTIGKADQRIVNRRLRPTERVKLPVPELELVSFLRGGTRC